MPSTPSLPDAHSLSPLPTPSCFQPLPPAYLRPRLPAPPLPSTGIAPPGIRGPVDDGLMPGTAGVGFTDVGTGHPGTDR